MGIYYTPQTDLRRPDERCENCRRWIPVLRNRYTGVCSQEDHAGRVVDITDVCKHFEHKDFFERRKRDPAA